MPDLAALAGLRATLPGLVLRSAGAAATAALAERLPPDYELDPTVVGAADPARRAEVLRRTVDRDLAAWRPDAWKLHLIATSADGVDVGMQVLEADGFARTRTVDSASWLVAEARGRGLGKAMRAAALALAFEGLGAEQAVTSAWSDNAPSLGVSRALGYRRTRDERLDGRDLVHLAITRAEWAARPRPQVQLEGVEPVLPLFVSSLG